MADLVVIVDLGTGNIGSIRNMLKRVGVDPVVSSEAADVRAAARIVLPGVGAFDAGMTRLQELDLVEVLGARALGAGVPTLGLCLGMQLMTRGSEEGCLPGLGWFDAQTERFQSGQNKPKVPHMGWNTVSPTRHDTLFRHAEPDSRYYFVHSYYVRCAQEDDVLAWAHHGCDFAAAIQHETLYGTQFHPEKSHRFGMQLLTNFLSGV
jgi:glutamine amidotransferase